jgi:hypothetical protein
LNVPVVLRVSSPHSGLVLSYDGLFLALQEIKRNFKTWAQKFETEDTMRKMTASKELIEKRQKLMEDFNNMRTRRDNLFQERKEERLVLRGGMLFSQFFFSLAIMESWHR